MAYVKAKYKAASSPRFRSLWMIGGLLAGLCCAASSAQACIVRPMTYGQALDLTDHTIVGEVSGVLPSTETDSNTAFKYRVRVLRTERGAMKSGAQIEIELLIQRARLGARGEMRCPLQRTSGTEQFKVGGRYLMLIKQNDDLFDLYWAESESLVKTYEYDFCECTGLTYRIGLNGEKVYIQFHPDSDFTAWKTLTSLDPFIRDINKQAIFVVGQYYEQPHRTPECENCPTSEEYHRFKLLDWYIFTPFKQLRLDNNDDPLGGMHTIFRNRLRTDDFLADGLEGVDLRRFQRTRSR